MRKRKTAGENEKNQIHFAVTTQEAGSQRAVTTGQKKERELLFPKNWLFAANQGDSPRPYGCALSGLGNKKCKEFVLAR